MAKTDSDNIYRRLGDKIDGLSYRTPWNEAYHGILKELYTPDEADVIVKMPYKLASLERISRVTGIEMQGMGWVREL